MHRVDDARFTPSPRWLHRWAVLTVCLTLPLLTLGAEVTTRRVGMVDPQGFRWPWEILALFADPANRANSALVIELTHRMFGFLVGLAAIVLCVGLLVAGRGWKRWLGVIALVAVGTQGLLGRYRVDRNEQLGGSLSQIHGFFAQIVFALLVSLAVFTSRSWVAAQQGTLVPRRLQRLAWITVGVVLVQVLLGGFVRHTYWTLGQRLHILVAFLVTGLIVYLIRESREGPRPMRMTLHVLSVLLLLQVSLGVEAWMSRMVLMSTTVQAFIRTAHFVIGASLFATTVAAALYGHSPRDDRHRASSEEPGRQLEEVAV